MTKNPRIFNIASYDSISDGLDYFLKNKVTEVTKTSKNIYECKVNGSGNNLYTVILDDLHLRKSTCTCPHCDGHQTRTCKHKVAAYFSLHPEEYEMMLEESKAYEKKCEAMNLEFSKKQKNIKTIAKKKALDKLDKLSDEQVRKELLKYLIKEYEEIEEDKLYLEYREYLYY